MNIVVSILDQDGNTDNIVLVNNDEKTLLWIPRDLYSLYIRNRVNAAFSLGGHELFLKVLENLGFHADYSICISNEAARAVLSKLKITVPIKYAADYYYPIKAFYPIEQGKKIVSFKPPYETLQGERIHQFLGARYRVNSEEAIDLPDFERIARQMLFIKQMLIEKFDFSVFLDKNISMSSELKIIEGLAQVDASYECKLYKQCKPFTIKRMSVLKMNHKPFLTLIMYGLKIYYIARSIKQKILSKIFK